MSVTTESINDADEWQQLSADEQSEILQQGLQTELGDEPGVGEIPRWDDFDETSQEQTIAAIEGALEETWTALLFEDDSRQTIPFEVSELTEKQQDELMEWLQVFGTLEQADAESVEGLRDELDDVDEIIDQLDDFEPWVDGYLAEITTGEAFDAQWWSSGAYPSGTRLELFTIVILRYEDQMAGAESFQ